MFVYHILLGWATLKKGKPRKIHNSTLGMVLENSVFSRVMGMN